jgi:hypothetical protein
MAVEKSLTEIPDSEDEPMTSSPDAISDHTDKLHPARHDPPQASQDASQDVACGTQALVKETTPPASKQHETLPVGQEDIETSEYKSSANAQPNGNDQRHDTTANAAPMCVQSSIGIISSKTEPNDGSPSNHQKFVASQSGPQPDSQLDQEEHAREHVVELTSMRKERKEGKSKTTANQTSLVPTVEESEPARAEFQTSSPTSNVDVIKEPTPVPHHNIQSDQLPSESPPKGPDCALASDTANEDTDSNAPITTSLQDIPSKAGQIKQGGHAEEDTAAPKPAPASELRIPAKSSQETTLAELKAQRTALLASIVALPNIQELITKNGDPSASPHAYESEPTDAEVMAAANKIVSRHIKLLHKYNEIKDVGQGLMGLIADQRGVRIVEVQDEFGIGPKD